MKTYSPAKTAAKMAPPFILIVLLQALKAALKSGDIELSDDVLYSATLAVYGGFIGLKNWFKNGHKRDVLKTSPENKPDKGNQKDAMQ